MTTKTTTYTEEQLEISEDLALPKKAYAYTFKALEGWTIDQLNYALTYIQVRIQKRDEKLYESFNHGIGRDVWVTHKTAFEMMQSKYDEVVDIETYRTSDRLEALDQLFLELGRPFYKRLLTAMRVKRSSSSSTRDESVKVSIGGATCVKGAAKSLSKLDVDMRKPELVALLLELGSEALESYTKAKSEGKEPQGDDFSGYLIDIMDRKLRK